MTIAVVGCGFIGQIYGRVITELGERVVAVVDPDAGRRDQLASRLRCAAYPSLTEMLDRERTVESVGIATPTYLHAEHVQEATSAGKNVLCEKPMANGLADVRAMIDGAERAGTKLAVGFKMRFEGLFTEIRQLIMDGTIGDPRRVLVTHHQPRPHQPWVLEDGVTRELLIHSIDMANWMLGSAPTAVSRSHASAESGHDVTSTLHLQFPSGRDALISGAWIDGFPPTGGRNDLVMQIVGTRGHLVALRPTTILLCNQAESRAIEVPTYAYAKPFSLEWAAFLRWVRGADSGILATGADGWAVHHTLDALDQARSRKRFAETTAPSQRATSEAGPSTEGVDQGEAGHA
jgi:myo-inositol 2-dehydrogenase / D-chiro-inositol 1-dehydrogenase